MAQQNLSTSASIKSDRLISLDVFRGITIMGMILVNNPGTWKYVYGPLRHADWHGWTPTDLIFPFFLFIVGVAMVFSFAKRAERGETKKEIFAHVIKRTIILFILGLFLNGFPKFDLSTIRILGVLQRIALVYFFASVLVLTAGVRTQIIALISLLVIYWLLMMFVPVPGYGVGVLTEEGNLAAYIDRLLLKGHLYRPTSDPEGLLSTLPAIATALFGVLTGHWLRTNRTQSEKTIGLFVSANALVVAGLIMSIWFPINKKIWTSSYAVFTAGLALHFLGMCYWLIEVKKYVKWSTPFLVFGTNAITVYFLSGLVARLLNIIQVYNPLTQSKIALKTYIYERVFASWLVPIDASLMYAVCYVLLWLGIMSIFYYKKIFIKI